jgi:hypothetical protein
MFELDLKNTILRSTLKFHNDRLTTAQVIVITRLQKLALKIDSSIGSNVIPKNHRYHFYQKKCHKWFYERANKYCTNEKVLLKIIQNWLMFLTSIYLTNEFEYLVISYDAKSCYGRGEERMTMKKVMWMRPMELHAVDAYTFHKSTPLL